MKLNNRYLAAGSVWLVLSLAAGMRWLGQGRDYDQYLLFYNSLDIHLDFGVFRYEPGFVLLAWISKTVIGLDFTGFLILMAAAALGIKFVLFFRRPYPWLIVAAYVPSLYLLHEMTQVRAALALAFVYLAIDTLWKRGRLSAIFLMLAGASMQASVLVFAPIIMAPKQWLMNKNMAIPLLIGVVFVSVYVMNISMSQLNLINPLIDTYRYGYGYSPPNAFSARNVLLMAVSAIGLLRYKHLSAEVRLQVALGILGFSLFFSLITAPVFAQRLFELFQLSYFLWVTAVPRRYLLPTAGMLLLLSFYLGYRQIIIDPLFS